MRYIASDEASVGFSVLCPADDNNSNICVMVHFVIGDFKIMRFLMHSYTFLIASIVVVHMVPINFEMMHRSAYSNGSRISITASGHLIISNFHMTSVFGKFDAGISCWRLMVG